MMRKSNKQFLREWLALCLVWVSMTIIGQLILVPVGLENWDYCMGLAVAGCAVSFFYERREKRFFDNLDEGLKELRDKKFPQ